MNESARFAFNLFYITVHVFAFLNTLVYWGAEVPAGHGGFRPPSFPKHHPSGPGSNATIAYNPNKGLFEEDDIKPFSIINLTIINSAIAGIEIFFLNSIRRPTPVAGQVAGVIFASFLYLVWAWFGGLVTGHYGIFFLNPDEMGGQMEAVIAACIVFVSLTPGRTSTRHGVLGRIEYGFTYFLSGLSHDIGSGIEEG
ncbi:hypothetical protein MGN70_014654 [Eutypa lata]|nr:hypothetical protein MGN70_014654 [Eutypa lata]